MCIYIYIYIYYCSSKYYPWDSSNIISQIILAFLPLCPYLPWISRNHQSINSNHSITDIKQISYIILNRHMVRRIINNNSRTRYELITKNRSCPLTLHIDVTLNETRCKRGARHGLEKSAHFFGNSAKSAHFNKNWRKPCLFCHLFAFSCAFYAILAIRPRKKKNGTVSKLCSLHEYRYSNRVDMKIQADHSLPYLLSTESGKQGNQIWKMW